MDVATRKINMRKIIISTYCPAASGSAGKAHSQKLEALEIMKIQNYPRTQLWMNLNKEISKWTHQGEEIILMGY